MAVRLLRWLTLGVLLVGLEPITAAADGRKLSGPEIKAVFSDNIDEGQTKKGLRMTINYNSDGSLVGELSNGRRDSGKWWVDRDYLCRRWNKFGRGKKGCYEILVSGNKVIWLSARDGKKIAEKTINDLPQRLANLDAKPQTPARAPASTPTPAGGDCAADIKIARGEIVSLSSQPDAQNKIHEILDKAENAIANGRKKVCRKLVNKARNYIKSN